MRDNIRKGARSKVGCPVNGCSVALSAEGPNVTVERLDSSLPRSTLLEGARERERATERVFFGAALRQWPFRGSSFLPGFVSRRSRSRIPSSINLGSWGFRAAAVESASRRVDRTVDVMVM